MQGTVLQFLYQSIIRMRDLGDFQQDQWLRRGLRKPDKQDTSSM